MRWLYLHYHLVDQFLLCKIKSGHDRCDGQLLTYSSGSFRYCSSINHFIIAEDRKTQPVVYAVQFLIVWIHSSQYFSEEKHNYLIFKCDMLYITFSFHICWKNWGFWMFHYVIVHLKLNKSCHFYIIRKIKHELWILLKKYSII